MKYCSKCGKELLDEAVICVGCGSWCSTPVTPQATEVKSSGLKLAAKILMILGTVFFGLYLIPLAWCIPMTVSYCKKIKTGEPISVGFKICSLLFVSTTAGIIMLIDKD